MKTDILIIGGGLSGLSAGVALSSARDEVSRTFLLVEGRTRLGGRILSESADESSHRYDLGPAWFWPGQPRIARNLHYFGIPAFEQHSTGNLVFQDTDGSVRRDLAFSPMAGALRIDGGVQRLSDAMAHTLPRDLILTGVVVRELHRTDTGIAAHLSDGRRIDATFVILAVPPRLAAQTIAFTPEDPETLQAMASVPTWMAAHAKLVAVYDRPFWRDAGLSGDGMSRRGPLMEIHDASPADVSRGALFGFVGTPAGDRGDGLAIRRDAVSQLTALFGRKAATPSAVLYRDWTGDPLTATPDDAVPPPGHPTYGPLPTWGANWAGHIALAASETAASFGGLLEGALEAGERAATLAIKAMKQSCPAV